MSHELFLTNSWINITQRLTHFLVKIPRRCHWRAFLNDSWQVMFSHILPVGGLSKWKFPPWDLYQLNYSSNVTKSISANCSDVQSGSCLPPWSNHLLINVHGIISLQMHQSKFPCWSSANKEWKQKQCPLPNTMWQWIILYKEVI